MNVRISPGIEVARQRRMCMIFKNVPEPLKQIAIWIGVVELLPLTAWYP